MHRDSHPPRRLSAIDADRLLQHAATLDARQHGDTIDVGALRDAATAAGIEPAAFDAALAEMIPDAGTRSKGPAVPWHVRVCLLGIRSRRVANAYHAFFHLALLATLIATSVLAFAAPARLVELTPLLSFLAVWALTCIWTSSRAIRWADRHGWDALP